MADTDISYDAPSWEYIETLTVKLFQKLKENAFHPDIIAGISRGGLVPARIISDLYLTYGEKPTLSVMQIGLYAGVGKTFKEPIIYQDLPGHIHGKKILLIDDVADSGISLDFALQYLSMKKPAAVKIGTLYYKPWSKIKPHYYVEETEAWIIFPHERYEFMQEQMKKKGLSMLEARKFFIEDIHLPTYSVDNFLSIKNNG
ncbi:MAG: phosphoribosyltransferase [Candidatus Heimdallarchaeota archaeon]|nr:phosphoribosyltransferase [Candidatus Heimdallarchaeota archaeon]